MREVKTFPLAEFKLAGAAGDAGSFEGRASTFGKIDSYGDVVDPGAYAETLPQFLTRGFIGWGHDWNDPIGIVATAEERVDGLYITGGFHSDADAQKCRLRASERLAAGKFMGLSIGYEALAWEMRQVDTPIRNQWGEFTDKVRALTKIKLFEVSIVTVPAEENSGVTAIKGYGLSEEDHSARVRVAVREYVFRLSSGSETRLKEGRAISSARRARMGVVADQLREAAGEIDALLVETEPAKAGDLMRLRFEFERRMARIHLEHGAPA